MCFTIAEDKQTLGSETQILEIESTKAIPSEHGIPYRCSILRKLLAIGFIVVDQSVWEI
jgi:hypothetical protein